MSTTSPPAGVRRDAGVLPQAAATRTGATS
jgi:hypothetical protein